jgi:hypothetical protein
LFSVRYRTKRTRVRGRVREARPVPYGLTFCVK